VFEGFTLEYVDVGQVTLRVRPTLAFLSP